MTPQPTTSILHHFSDIKDPRINRQKTHQLQDIFFITLCGVICGADNWVMIEEFGKSMEAWFTEQLGLQHGIPSHDTFGAVFAAIDSEQFSLCFSRWAADLATLSGGEVIAVDGKTVRRSVDKASKKAAIHMVSAWAEQNHLVLGQTKVDTKSNEITAIPNLLKQLDITGATITIDAMGCQKKIVQQIIDQQGNYLISLKGNQGELHDDVKTYFSSDESKQVQLSSVNGGHGRIETRILRASDDIQWLRDRHPQWANLNSIVAVTAQRELKNKTERDTRYFISSLGVESPEQLARTVRAHWAVENNLHWVLDVAFDEDSNRTRKGHSAANLAIMRHISLNLIKAETSSKVGVKTKRAKAGRDNKYLLKVLGIN